MEKDVIREKLEEVISLLRQLGEKTALSGGLLKKKEAARALGIGLTKLEGLVRRGEITARTLGGRQLIPHSEVLRLGRPETKQARSGRRARTEYDPTLEAEKSRALRHKRNRKP